MGISVTSFFCSRLKGSVRGSHGFWTWSGVKVQGVWKTYYLGVCLENASRALSRSRGLSLVVGGG